MRTIFSTTDVHPRDRFDYWHEVANRNLVGHQSEPECQQSFQAELQVGAFAGLGLVLFGNSPMTVAVPHAMPCMPTRIKSSYVDCSRASCSWRRKAARPFWSPVISRCSIRGCRTLGKFLAGSRMLVLKSRRRPLEARIGKTSELTVRLFKRSGTANQLTSAFLTMLPACSGRPGPPDRGDRRGPGTRSGCRVARQYSAGRESARFICPVADHHEATCRD